MPDAPVIGDTIVGEALDYVGDVDEFVIVGTPGDEYNVLFQSSVAAPPAPALFLEVPDAPAGVDNPEERQVLSFGPATPLTERASGRFALPASGRATVRVAGLDRWSPARGAYRLYVHHVSRAPESAPVRIALGDSVGERIEAPGGGIVAEERELRAERNDMRALGGDAGFGGLAGVEEVADEVEAEFWR
jgi:hypothetical protein